MWDSASDLVASGAFWMAIGTVFWVNILLSADNAVVIALAARGLPQVQQKTAIFWGSAAAIVLRVVLTLIAVQMLQFPFLKLAGAVVLLWIGARLLLPEDVDREPGVKASSKLFDAIRTILVADLMMSVDNVIAVAAAAETGPSDGRMLVLVIGLGLSIPLIIVGSQLLLSLMARWPIIITIGAALLGFVAGQMAVSDPAIDPWFQATFGNVNLAIGAASALLVVLIGQTWASRLRSRCGAVNHG